MRITISTLSIGLGLASASVLPAACSSGSTQAAADGGNGGLPTGDGGGCPPYESDANLTAPAVSFATDVMPLFEQSCGLSTCHGGDPATTVAQRGVFLGCTPSASCKVTGDPGPQVYSALLGPNAERPAEESCMPFVTPGDPTKSYLLYKMDNDLCGVACCTENNTAAASVGATGCGSIMPYLQAALPSSSRDTIRRWIQQGAKNN